MEQNITQSYSLLQGTNENNRAPKRLMLNSDIALIKNISKSMDGRVFCTYNSCPDVNSESVSWVSAIFGEDMSEKVIILNG